MWNDINRLSHTKWNCKYHIVFAPKYRRKEFYGNNRLEIRKMLREFGSKRYYVDTARKNAEMIKNYIDNQLR